MKLGEILLEKGLLNEHQLESALKSQLIYGGYLGTCLVEMGLVDEDTLGRALSEAIGIPYAPASLFEDIPESAIQVVPGRIAEEYHVVPLKIVDKGSLHLAMIDPKNLPALDDISFVIGRRVIPWIAPEIRIFQALERYYGIARRPRYITICREIEMAALKKAQTSSGTTEPAREAVPAERFDAARSEVHPPPGKVRPAGNSGGDRDPSEESSMEQDCDYGRSWQEVADRMAADSLRRAESPAENPIGATTGSSGASHSRPSGSRQQSASRTDGTVASISLDQAAQRICEAETQSALGETVMDFCAGRMKRTLLFRVSGIRALVWQVRGLTLTEELGKSSFGVTSEGIFKALLGSDYYRGTVPECEGTQGVYRSLNLELPAEIVLVPVHVDDRLVAVLLGDGGPDGRVSPILDDLLRMVRLFALGMKLLLMKKKIRDSAFSPTAQPSDAAGRLKLVEAMPSGS